MAKATCSFGDCPYPVHGHGLCNTHYRRVDRSGDVTKGATSRVPTVFAVVEVDPVECFFLPGSDGRPLVVTIKGRKERAHRAVLRLTAGPPPPGSEACHNCGNGHLGCITPRHLRWDTKSANQMDRVGHSTSNRGRAHPQSVLTESKVREIRRLLAEGHKGVDIAARFGVAEQTVCEIKKGRNWGWLH